MKSLSSLLSVYALVVLTICCQGQKEQIVNNQKANSTVIDSIQVAQIMREHGLKGLSLAVFDNYEIVYTGAWGVKDTVSNDLIDLQTAFSAASIAKPVTATLFALLEHRGLIDLSEPVKNYLKRWQLPDSEFDGAGNITLEQLLSHTAGTSQHGFMDFYVGDTIPTMIESLNGEIGDNDAIRFISEPGTGWSYSGGGYVIAQLAVEDHLDATLADLADDYLFNPLKLSNTTFRQPNEPGFLTNVAKAHNEEGQVISTGVPITPQIAPSGLWTTPHDLAVFMIAMQKALAGDDTGVIPPIVAQRVTEVVTTDVMGGWSMGWERRFGYGNQQWFSHGGANTGIGGHVYGTMEGGKGIAMQGNGPNSIRFPVLDSIRNLIIEQYQWYQPLDRNEEQELAAELQEGLVGTYQHVLFGEEATLVYRNDQMIFLNFVPGKQEAELVYLGDNEFLVDEYPVTIRFEVYNDTLYIRPKHLSFNELSNYNYKKIN